MFGLTNSSYSFFVFFLEFYSLMILSLLNFLYVIYGQNGSILDLDIVIFTGMFSPLKNSTSFSLGVVHRQAALVSPGMPVRYRISDPNPELLNQNLHFKKILAGPFPSCVSSVRGALVGCGVWLSWWK